MDALHLAGELDIRITLLLRHGVDEPELATTLERAIDQALVRAPTADAGGSATTAEFTAVVRAELDSVLA